MFLLLSLCMCGLLLRGDAQDRAALWRGNDRSGRCQYTFTVPSPTEASCPQIGGPEMEGLKARLSMLEVLVSRLTGGDTGGPPGAGARAQSELQEALNRAMGERNLLQGQKQRLEQDLDGLQRRMEEMRRETERLRNRPCPPQTPMVPPSPSLQGSGLMRPAGGKRYTQTTTHFKSYFKNVQSLMAFINRNLFLLLICYEFPASIYFALCKIDFILKFSQSILQLRCTTRFPNCLQTGCLSADSG